MKNLSTATQTERIVWYNTVKRALYMAMYTPGVTESTILRIQELRMKIRAATITKEL